MNISKPGLAAAAVLGLVALTSLWLHYQDYRPVIYMAAQSLVTDVVDMQTADPDDFKLLFCGTGSPNRTPDRGQPCTALVAAGKLFVFDAGEGAIGKLIEYGAPTGALSAIFLTHLHSDHISGVGELLHNTWLFARRNEVEIVGPPGTAEMLEGFNLAYRQDLLERNRVLGPENVAGDIAFSGAREVTVADSSARVVYNKDGLVIKAFAVEHPDWNHAYGYRIEYRGKVIVISGDTRASDNLVKHANGADFLIHEAVNTEIFQYVGELMQALGGPVQPDRVDLITRVHTPTLELAKIGADAGVENLVVTHLIPALPDLWVAERFFVAGMDDIYKGNLMVARDGQWLDVR